MTFAATPCLRLEPDLARQWLPKIHARLYDPRNLPVDEKAGLTIGMAMTEKQGGSDVRANATRAIRIGRDGQGEVYELVGHKFFVSAPMCDAFLVLAQAPGGLTCFLAPRWRPDRTKNPMSHSAQAQDGQPFQRLERDRMARRAGLARRAGRARRRHDHRDGGRDPLRLHDRLLGAACAWPSPRRSTIAASARPSARC